MALSPDERYTLAQKRLHSVLRRHIVATDRILEMKISDAGPFPQRIDPHILTPARQALVASGKILTRTLDRTPWYYLPGHQQHFLETRLEELHQLHLLTQQRDLTLRVGQALEIAVFRALSSATALRFFGDYPDLDEHDDSRLYSKTEPPATISGKRIGKQNLDFIVENSAGIMAGLEVKNIRQWIYPQREEIRDALLKCCVLDLVPVFISRRIHYLSFAVFGACGMVFHQNYRQYYPATAENLAIRVKNKRLLGYHDILIGNTPDPRLSKFIHSTLPRILPAARQKFYKYRDLLELYATRKIKYDDFSKMLKTWPHA